MEALEAFKGLPVSSLPRRRFTTGLSSRNGLVDVL
jgi:hypothetical protein